MVDPSQTDQLVNYDDWGRVELTTLTKEFFMPRFLERDEALRRRPFGQFAWDARFTTRAKPGFRRSTLVG